MTDDADELDRHLARLFEDGRRREDPQEHPAPEELSAYQANELPSEEADRIQEHLVQCSFCTELLLDLERFLAPPKEDLAREGVADLETEADWRKLRRQLGGERKQRRIVFPAWAASLILGFLLVPLLISFWRIRELREQTTGLREQVMELRQPQVNVPFLEMRSTRGNQAEMPAGQTVQLDLQTSDPESYAAYQAEIAQEDGTPLWSGRLQKDRDGKLTLTLVSGFLEPGSYRVRLSGLRDGQPKLLEDYPLLVTRQ